MDATNTLNREIAKTGLFGANFPAEASIYNQDKVLEYIVDAALVLADKIIAQKNQYQKRF